MAKLDTDLNVSPYYDDYDETKNFHRVLFRPAVPLQAREITQLQTIMQDQIERFGRYQFKEGSVITGCAFSTDSKIKYAKILDKTLAGTDVNVNAFGNGDYIVASSNLVAQIIKTQFGLQSQNPNLNTLFYHYLNTGTAGETQFVADQVLDIYPSAAAIESVTVNTIGAGYSNSDTVVFTNTRGVGAVASVNTYSNGAVQSIVMSANGSGYTYADLPTVAISSANATVNASLTVVLSGTASVTVANSLFGTPVGNSYLLTVTDGVIFQKGHFVRNTEQSVIVSPYTDRPTGVVVGFATQEAIVNSSIDTSLLDNAAGYNNENAPGADRLKLTPVLVVNTTTVAESSNNFLSLIKFDNGQLVELKKTQFADMGEVAAKRTYEESGDYVVEPFSVTTTAIPDNSTQVYCVVGSGVGYARGQRFETLGASRMRLDKATTTANIDTLTITTAYGQYVRTQEVLGSFGHSTGDMVLLMSAHHNPLSSNVNSTLSISDYSHANTTLSYNGVNSKVVGTARIRSVVCEDVSPKASATVYQHYLYDIKMSSGKSFAKHARSLFHYSGTAYSATGAETNDSLVGLAEIILTGSVAKIIDQSRNQLVFPVGQNGVKSIGANSSFVFKTQANVQFATTGEASKSVAGTNTFNFGTVTSTLTSAQEKNVTIIPQASVNVASSISTSAAVANGTTLTITGCATGTLSIGDCIYVSNVTVTALKQVVTVIDSTSFTVNSPFAGSMTGATVLETYQKGIPVPLGTDTLTTVEVSSAGQLLSFDLNKTLASTLDTTVAYDVKSTSQAGAAKSIVTSYVKIHTSNNAGGSNGPWSLGIPDVFDVQEVYVDSSSYLSSGTNRINNFVLDNGQKDGYYGLANLKKSPTQRLTTTAKYITVKVRHFTKDVSGGFGFFSASSYTNLLDETNPDNTKIATQDIPMFVSPQTGLALNLRNSIDFRSFVTATAATGVVVGSATINPSNVEIIDGEQYAPTPNEQWQSSAEYYLPRKDRLVITDNSLRIIKGTPAEQPIAPKLPGKAMQLAEIEVPVFPSLDVVTAFDSKAPNYAIKITATQLKRYTMRDIKSLDDRITALEYYTALNALEQQSSQQVIPGRTDSTLNRFKNGIVVDNFGSKTTGDLLSADHQAGFEQSVGQLIPKMETYDVSLKLGTAPLNIDVSSDIAHLKYTQKTLVSQPRATGDRKCTSLFWNYSGKLKLFPDYFSGADYSRPPVPIINSIIDTSSGTLGLVQELNKVLSLAFNDVDQVVGVQNRTVTTDSGIVTNTDDSQTQTTNITSSLTTQTRSVNASFAAQSFPSTKAVGDFVTDITMQPYIPAMQIRFVATGLRPNMVHHVFFDGVLSDAECAPATTFVPTSMSQAQSNILRTKAKGSSISSDVRGILTGILYLPSGQYFVGEREFMVTDVTSYSQRDDFVSKAVSHFNAFNFSTTKQQFAVTSTRPPVIAGSVAISTGSRTSNNSTDIVTTIPAPVITVNNTIITVNNIIPADATPVANTAVTPPIVEPVANTVVTPLPEPPLPEVDFVIPDMRMSGGDLWWSVDLSNLGIGSDPISQSFNITPGMTSGSAGCYLSSIDVYFKSKDPRTGVTIEIRTMVNGVPSSEILPFSTVTKRSSEVSVSTNGSAATTFAFPDPVYVKSGVEYCFVVLPEGNSPDYSVFTSKAGDRDLVSNIISNQDWGQGSMFLSTNSRTWVTYPDEDVKFLLRQAWFTNTSGRLTFVNEDYEWLIANNQTINGVFSNSEDVFKLAANATGNVSFTTGSSTVTGIGTSFVGIPAGARIVLTSNSTAYDVVTVNSVSNNTVLTLKGAPTITDGTGNYFFAPTAVFDRQDANTGTIVLRDSTAANATFLFASGDTIIGAVSGANCVIDAPVDTNISYLEPKITRSEPDLTSTVMYIKARKASSNAYSSIDKLDYNKRFYPGISTASIKVMSKSNEITNFGGNKSLVVLQDLSTPNKQVSPIVDLQSQALTVYENIINNDSSDEYKSEVGNASFKYCSRTITLNEGLDAEDLKVYVDAYLPTGCSIEAYARVVHQADTTSIKDALWSRLQITQNEGVSSVENNRNDIIEYMFEPMDTLPTTKKAGSVTITSGSTAVTGSGTSFSSDYVAGDLIKILTGPDPEVDYQLSSVVSVTDNTNLVIADEAVSTINVGVLHYRVDDEYKTQLFRDPNGTVDYIGTYYNAANEKFEGYKSLAIKVVVLSDSTSKTPYLDNMRAIAVSL
mgnify:CR=1 FL=1|tara:strand:+ start:8806 stop:15456 length:6651 start_codon:yes stop_codon:yes gene_type:complete